MSALIDRDKLLRRIKKCAGAADEHCDLYSFIEDVLYMVRNAKVIEAEPVVHSWWIPHPGYRDWDICYACGTGTKRREYGPVENNREWVTEYGYKYCPHCGAKMDGKENVCSD